MNDQSFIDGLRSCMPKSIPVCSCCGMTEEEGHDSECFWYEAEVHPLVHLIDLIRCTEPMDEETYRTMLQEIIDDAQTNQFNHKAL